MKKRSNGKSEKKGERGRQKVVRQGPGKKAAGPEKTELTPQTEPFCAEVVRLRKRQRRLRTALESVRSQLARLTSHCSAIESDYARLMRFYVATQRLLDAQSSEDLFGIIHEIVADLVGCQEFGIFRVDEHCTLSLVSSCGIDEEKLQRIPLGSSLIGTTALKGEAYFIGAAHSEFHLSQESNLTACVPLKRQGQLFGAVAVFRLLPQKAGLDPEDQELLCLVGRLAAIVLLCKSTFCHTVAVGASG